MNTSLRRCRPLLLALLAAAFLPGCDDGGGGSRTDYSGSWRGRTSHGGSVAFTVDGLAVHSFQIDDPQAKVRLVQPVSIKGDSFSAENSEGVSAPDSPAVTLRATFDSPTQCFGSYSLRKGSQALTGTFEASRP